jgi:hypothetical protein
LGNALIGLGGPFCPIWIIIQGLSILKINSKIHRHWIVARAVTGDLITGK